MRESEPGGRGDDCSKRGSGMVQFYYIIFKGSELEKGGKN